MRLTFLGSGDAFGSGGRFHTCILVETSETRFLVDCGGSAIAAIQQRGIDTAGLDMMFLTHLHGDHIGGLPYVLLDAHFVRRRTAPLLVAGPPGTSERLVTMMDVLYPGAWAAGFRFPVDITELAAQAPG